MNSKQNINFLDLLHEIFKLLDKQIGVTIIQATKN